jgi:hypothetical protein
MSGKKQESRGTKIVAINSLNITDHSLDIIQKLIKIGSLEFSTSRLTQKLREPPNSMYSEEGEYLKRPKDFSEGRYNSD